ncbi:MAG: hypothetical protein ACXQS2_01835 [Methermicoccaceae archaeon]
MELLTMVLINVLGFLIGGILMIVIGAVSVKFFTRRIIREAISDETKEKIAEWFEDVLKNGVSEALKDEDVRKIILEILEVGEKKLKGENEEG